MWLQRLLDSAKVAVNKPQIQVWQELRKHQIRTKWQLWMGEESKLSRGRTIMRSGAKWVTRSVGHPLPGPKMDSQVRRFDLLLDVRWEARVGSWPRKKTRACVGKVQTQLGEQFQQQTKSYNFYLSGGPRKKEKRHPSTSQRSTVLFTFIISQFRLKPGLALLGHAPGFSVHKKAPL